MGGKCSFIKSVLLCDKPFVEPKSIQNQWIENVDFDDNNYIFVAILQTLQTKCCHNENSVASGGTGGCHYNYSMLSVNERRRFNTTLISHD